MHSTIMLGECYRKGLGVAKDVEIAMRQFEKGAAAGLASPSRRPLLFPRCGGVAEPRLLVS